MSIRIIADTMCDVPEEFVRRYNIKVMPLKVHFGEESFLDGIDITAEEFFERLAKVDELPKTSQVTPLEFIKAFSEELEKGNTIITVLGSSHLSGTYNSAVLAKQQLGNKNIYIIDSEAITLGAGMLVIKAARLAEEGKSAEEIVRTIEESKKRMRQFLIIGDLKYIYKGGRISFSSSVIGSVLNIKPILTMTDGKLEMIEKSRGVKKAISILLDMIKNKGWTFNDKIIGINHTLCPEYADYFEELIKDEYHVKEIIRGKVGAVVGTHAGPGCVAFYFEV